MQASPQYSPDGQWFWTGVEWVPAPPVPASPVPAPTPSPADACKASDESDVAGSAVPAQAGSHRSLVRLDPPFTFPAAWEVVRSIGAACLTDEHCLQRVTMDGCEHWRCASCGETRRVLGAELRPTGNWCFGCQKRLDEWGGSEAAHYMTEHGRRICKLCTGAALSGSPSCRGHQVATSTAAEAPRATLRSGVCSGCGLPIRRAALVSQPGRSDCGECSKPSLTAPGRGAPRWLMGVAAVVILTAAIIGIHAASASHHSPAVTNFFAANESNTTSSSFDVRSTTCAQFTGYSDAARVAAGRAMLTIMARNEGVKVTDDVNNQFVVQLNNACDAQPTSLVSLAASAAYVRATGG